MTSYPDGHDTVYDTYDTVVKAGAAGGPRFDSMLGGVHPLPLRLGTWYSLRPLVVANWPATQSAMVGCRRGCQVTNQAYRGDRIRIFRIAGLLLGLEFLPTYDYFLNQTQGYKHAISLVT